MEFVRIVALRPRHTEDQAASENTPEWPAAAETRLFLRKREAPPCARVSGSTTAPVSGRGPSDLTSLLALRLAADRGATG